MRSCCCGGWLRRKAGASHTTQERQSTDPLLVHTSQNKLTDDLLHVRKPGFSDGAQLDSLSTHLHQSRFKESTSEAAEISSQSTDLPLLNETAKRPPFGSSTSKKSATKVEEVVNSFKQVDISRLDEFIEVIKQLLQRIVTPDQKDSATTRSSNSDNLSGWASIIESGKTFLSFVSDNAEKVDAKKDFFMSGEAVKIAGDILQQVGRIHWMVGALSVTGYLISKCRKVSENQEGYIDLLRKMVDLASYINNLNILVSLNEKNEKEEKLLNAFQFIIEGSMFCAAQLNSGKFCSFFKSSVNSDTLNAIRSKISDFYQNLNSTVNIEMLQAQSVSLEVSLPEYPKDAVGIKNQLEEIHRLLKMERSDDHPSLVLILWGAGGIGKTTLAKAVISKIDRSRYNYARIILEENFEYSQNKYIKMQQQILQDAFPNYNGGRKIKLRDTEDGKDKLREAFKGNKAIFLYIDNALNKKDLEELLPKDLTGLPQNSRILITTRTKGIADVLEKRGLSTDRIIYYSVKALSDNDAMELLCQDPAIRHRMEADLQKIVDVCHGFPLVLQIIGADLRDEKYDSDRCRQIIDETINDINQGRDFNEFTHRMFHFVYNKLDENTKEAFLDICGFLVDSESRRFFEYIVGIREVRRLEEAALITPVVEESNAWSTEEEWSVHDIIRSIGRRLGKSRRIMDINGLVEAEKDEAILKKIEAVCLADANEGYTLQEGHLNKMKEKLKIVVWNDKINVNVTNKVTLPELRHVDTDSDISWLNVEALHKLVSLQCEQLHTPETGLLKLPESLKKLSLRSVKQANTKDFLNIVPNSSLEDLYVAFEGEDSSEEEEGGEDSSEEEEGEASSEEKEGGEASTDENENEASSEKEAEASTKAGGDKASIQEGGGKASIEEEEEEASAEEEYQSPEVFNKFLGGLNNLKFLCIDNCQSVSEFPEQICRLPRLKELYISSFIRVECLPESFGQLRTLTFLDLSYCERLKTLPYSIGQLTNLTHLDLSYCETLDELPSTVGQLINLTHLDLGSCEGLKELPETFGQLEALRDLSLNECSSLERLPSTFLKLTNLTNLDLSGCSRLEKVSYIVQGLRNCVVEFNDISSEST